MVYLKKLRPLVLYLTYQLVQILITLNRTDVSLFKKLTSRYGERIVLILFIYTV